MLKNRRTVRVEWGDCDPAGIVWYPRYFGYFDASTQYLFEVAGFSKPEMINKFNVIGYPMVDTGAKFMIPSRFGDDIVIETMITEFGRSSFKVRHTVFKGAQIAIEATETRVLVRTDPETSQMKSCPIPQEIIEFFKNKD